jgi:hypothetical protein
MALQTLGKSDATGTFYVDVTYDAASVTNGASADLAVPVPGVLAGVDEICNVKINLNATNGILVQSAHVSADDTVTVRLSNVSGAPIDLASATWRFLIHRFGRA